MVATRSLRSPSRSCWSSARARRPGERANDRTWKGLIAYRWSPASRRVSSKSRWKGPVGSYAIRSTPDPIQAIRPRRPASSFGTGMLAPPARRRRRASPWRCRSRRCEGWCQDAGKDGGDQTPYGPSRPAERTARPPPRGRFWPEAPRLSPPNRPKPEHPIDRQAEQPERGSRRTGTAAEPGHFSCRLTVCSGAPPGLMMSRWGRRACSNTIFPAAMSALASLLSTAGRHQMAEIWIAFRQGTKTHYPLRQPMATLPLRGLSG